MTCEKPAAIARSTGANETSVSPRINPVEDARFYRRVFALVFLAILGFGLFAVLNPFLSWNRMGAPPRVSPIPSQSQAPEAPPR